MTAQRREHRNTHLNASIVPVENALLARSTVLASEAGARDLVAALRVQVRVHGSGKDVDAAEVFGAAIASVLAAEFSALAEELHYW